MAIKLAQQILRARQRMHGRRCVGPAPARRPRSVARRSAPRAAADAEDEDGHIAKAQRSLAASASQLAGSILGLIGRPSKAAGADADAGPRPPTPPPAPRQPALQEQGASSSGSGGGDSTGSAGTRDAEAPGRSSPVRPYRRTIRRSAAVDPTPSPGDPTAAAATLPADERGAGSSRTMRRTVRRSIRRSAVSDPLDGAAAAQQPGEPAASTGHQDSDSQAGASTAGLQRLATAASTVRPEGAGPAQPMPAAAQPAAMAAAAAGPAPPSGHSASPSGQSGQGPPPSAPAAGAHEGPQQASSSGPHRSPPASSRMQQQAVAADAPAAAEGGGAGLPPPPMQRQQAEAEAEAGRAASALLSQGSSGAVSASSNGQGRVQEAAGSPPAGSDSDSSDASSSEAATPADRRRQRLAMRDLRDAVRSEPDGLAAGEGHPAPDSGAAAAAAAAGGAPTATAVAAAGAAAAEAAAAATAPDIDPPDLPPPSPPITWHPEMPLPDVPLQEPDLQQLERLPEVVAAVEAMTSRLVTLQPVAQLTTLVGLQPQQLAALLALHEQGRLLPLLEQAAGLARQPPGQGPQLINRVDVYRRQLQALMQNVRAEQDMGAQLHTLLSARAMHDQVDALGVLLDRLDQVQVRLEELMAVVLLEQEGGWAP